MTKHGGSRNGAGRKPKHEEDRVRDIARTTLINNYGSEELAFKALLSSGEPSLIKFVYEHAYGKPKDKVDVNNSGVITLKILRGKKSAT